MNLPYSKDYLNIPRSIRVRDIHRRIQEIQQMMTDQSTPAVTGLVGKLERELRDGLIAKGQPLDTDVFYAAGFQEGIHYAREIIAEWMTKNEYATGHGDTVDELLKEIKWQIEEKIHTIASGNLLSHHAKTDELFYIRSMSKWIRITYVTTTDKDANAYMERHKDEGVIAEFGPFIFLANVHDRGLKNE